jgi:hypothetical protein
MKSCFENKCPSPDGSGKPFEKNGYFFLYRQSDWRKLLQVLRKKQFLKKIETNSWISSPKLVFFVGRGKWNLCFERDYS